MAFTIKSVSYSLYLSVCLYILLRTFFRAVSFHYNFDYVNEISIFAKSYAFVTFGNLLFVWFFSLFSFVFLCDPRRRKLILPRGSRHLVSSAGRILVQVI